MSPGSPGCVERNEAMEAQKLEMPCRMSQIQMANALEPCVAQCSRLSDD